MYVRTRVVRENQGREEDEDEDKEEEGSEVGRRSS